MKHFFIIPLLITFIVLAACSQSGRRKVVPNEKVVQVITEKMTVKMEKVNGVYQIPVDVNGVRMHFIFDTGASIISISETEANFLYKQGKLTDDDIRGTASFTDANGDISEGTIIILKTVKIGERILNDIEASVVHNLQAPLLFGQSALERFGRISIDNNKSEIVFE